ncbi:hypothetical protein H4R19_002115 [Coemansia spiralis]|nr:hypothetical protein H4R19_002115 [Coemansia spiralis]
MDLGSAEERAREEEAAARQAAADEIFLKDVERQIKAFIEVKLAAEVESARLPEFKGRIIVLLRSAEQAADDKAEAAFQDARAEPEKFKTEPLVTRDRIKELKKELSEREELLQRQVERRTVCENKVVALARDTLARKGSKYHAEARAVLLKDAMRRMDVSLAAVEQMCVAMDQRFVEAEEAKRRAQQQARSAEPRSWQQIAAAKRLA